MKFLPFIWRNLTRNKLRSFLTGGAIALAISLVCLLQTMPEGLNRLIEDVASNSRVVVHNEAGLVYPLPYAYLQKVRALPGVVGAASWTWFGGVFEVEKGVTFPNFAVEPDAIGVVWADWKIDPQQLEDFRRYRDGAIVGRGTLEKYDWKIGDLVTLKGTLYPIDLSFRIVGEIPNARAPHFWFQREYLEQALRAAGSSLDVLGTIWLRVDDRARVDPLMREIDTMFRNSEAETASETEKSYFKSFFTLLEGFVVVILLVTGVVALCIVFIAANTASMAVRERFRRDRDPEGAGLRPASDLLDAGGGGGSALHARRRRGRLRVAGAHAAHAHDRLRRLERVARSARQLHRDALDPGAGPLPRALRGHDLGRRAVLGRGAPQRRGDPARGVLSRVAAALSPRQPRRAPPAHGAHGRRDRAGGARHHAVRRARLESRAHARHDRLGAQPRRDAQGRDERRLERRDARCLPERALLRGRRARRRQRSPGVAGAGGAAVLPDAGAAGARTCSCAASSRSRSRSTTR